VGIQLAIVALYVLVLAGSLVGLSLGVFLPTMMPGACAGVAFATLIGSFIPSQIFFPIAAPSLALVGSGISAK